MSQMLKKSGKVSSSCKWNYEIKKDTVNIDVYEYNAMKSSSKFYFSSGIFNMIK